jgi:hypothetical protein
MKMWAQDARLNQFAPWSAPGFGILDHCLHQRCNAWSLFFGHASTGQHSDKRASSCRMVAAGVITIAGSGAAGLRWGPRESNAIRKRARPFAAMLSSAASRHRKPKSGATGMTLAAGSYQPTLYVLPSLSSARTAAIRILSTSTMEIPVPIKLGYRL